MSTKQELVSIIIPCCNQVEFTRLCLDSLKRFCTSPCEVILIDNGSSDATPEVMEAFAKQPPIGLDRTQIVRNAHNRGFAAAINQGLTAAQGSMIVLLNNDTVLTPHWLEGLVTCAQHGAGLVGPTSNYVPAPQYVRPGYDHLSGLVTFAEQQWQRYRGQALPVERLSGFCLLIRREVLARIGLLDERFGVGFFEDDDLCFRAKDAGFRLAVALDVYIHHFGSKTFAGLGLPTETLLQNNFKQFQSKWGAQRTAGYQFVPSQTKHPPLHNNGKLPEKAKVSTTTEPTADSEKATVSLCMIVKNEEDNLDACLLSIKHLVHEMVIVDTGSTDRTKEIALAHGAKVVDFPWIDNFAAARNISLDHATSDYAFWLDADDRIDPLNVPYPAWIALC
jgi:GT2 family glycosyltransferase